MAKSTKIKTEKTPPAGCKKNDNGGIEVNQIIIDLICERLAGGFDMVQVCSMPDMPSRTAVFYATGKNPDWKAQIDAVKPLQAERHVRSGFDALQKAVNGEIDVSAADKLAGMHRWAAQRIDPKNWGDKVSQEHTGADGGSIKVAHDDKDVARRIAFALTAGSLSSAE